MTALAFLRDMDRPSFIEKLRATHFLDDAELAALNAEYEAVDYDEFSRRHPHLDRDRGAEILSFVAESPNGIVLKNSIRFAGNSLSCEWAYVIDFDANTFEVYRGFNESPVPDGERFADASKLEKEDGYYPVRFVVSWSLTALPSDQDFLAMADPPEEEASN